MENKKHLATKKINVNISGHFIVRMQNFKDKEITVKLQKTDIYILIAI